MTVQRVAAFVLAAYVIWEKSSTRNLLGKNLIGNGIKWEKRTINKKGKNG